MQNFLIPRGLLMVVFSRPFLSLLSDGSLDLQTLQINFVFSVWGSKKEPGYSLKLSGYPR